MRALVTGGAGFIGSHLCEALLERGWEVICVDNFVTGSKKNVEHLLDNKLFTLIEHDISQPLEIKGDIHGVFHFASPASPIDYLKLPIQTLKVGGLGTHNTLGIARAKKARYLLASTSEIYGDPEQHPQKESYWGNVNPIGVRGCYDEAKRFAEAITMAYHRYHDIDTRIVRIFNTYGPRMRIEDGRVVPNFIAQALRNEPLTVYGDGTQTRSFCYVTDLIEGIIKLFEAPGYDPVNLGNPDEHTIKEFAERIIEIMGASSSIVYKPLPADDPKRRRPDISRAKERLKWEPKVSLEEGMQKTIDWFKSQ